MRAGSPSPLGHAGLLAPLWRRAPPSSVRPRTSLLGTVNGGPVQRTLVKFSRAQSSAHGSAGWADQPDHHRTGGLASHNFSLKKLRDAMQRCRRRDDDDADCQILSIIARARAPPRPPPPPPGHRRPPLNPPAVPMLRLPACCDFAAAASSGCRRAAVAGGGAVRRHSIRPRRTAPPRAVRAGALQRACWARAHAGCGALGGWGGGAAARSRLRARSLLARRDDARTPLTVRTCARGFGACGHLPARAGRRLRGGCERQHHGSHAGEQPCGAERLHGDAAALATALTRRQTRCSLQLPRRSGARTRASAPAPVSAQAGFLYFCLCIHHHSLTFHTFLTLFYFFTTSMGS